MPLTVWLGLGVRIVGLIWLGDGEGLGLGFGELLAMVMFALAGVPRMFPEESLAMRTRVYGPSSMLSVVFIVRGVSNGAVVSWAFGAPVGVAWLPEPGRVYSSTLLVEPGFCNA